MSKKVPKGPLTIPRISPRPSTSKAEDEKLKKKREVEGEIMEGLKRISMTEDIPIVVEQPVITESRKSLLMLKKMTETFRIKITDLEEKAKTITKSINLELQTELGKIELAMIEEMARMIEMEKDNESMKRENEELRKRLSRRDTGEIRERDTQVRKIERSLERVIKDTKDIKDVYSLVIQSKDGENENTRTILKNELDLDNKKIKVDDVILTKSNKLVLKAGRREVLEELKTWSQTKESLRNKIEISEPKRNVERIIVLGVSQDTNKERIMEELKDIQKEGSETYIDLIRPIMRKDGLVNWVLDVDRETGRNLVNRERMCIDYMRVRIVEYLRIQRCFKCQAYGHISTYCKKDDRCAKCAGNHETRACAEVYEKCVNCSENNAHRSDSPKCPIFQKWKRDTLSKRL